MKQVIVAVCFILLGVVIFNLVMGAGDTSLVGLTKKFFTDMASAFTNIASTVAGVK